MKNLGGVRKQSRKQKEEKILENKDDITDNDFLLNQPELTEREHQNQKRIKTVLSSHIKPEKELRYKTPENLKKVSTPEVSVINPEQAILAVQAVQTPSRGKNRQSYYCDLCLVQLNSYENMREHRRCKKHWENWKAHLRMKKLENSLEDLKIKDIRRLTPKN